jgi:N-acetylmuramoyl-L-alanine amidase
MNLILTVALAAFTLATQPARAGSKNASSPQNGAYSSLTSDDLTRKVQVALENRGYYTENTAGRYTSQTRAAVRRFERDNNLTETGTITPDVLRALSIK